jgi:hypothetical protein
MESRVPHFDPAGLGQRIAAARTAQRLMQTDRAGLANVPTSMFKKIDQGARIPSDEGVDRRSAVRRRRPPGLTRRYLPRAGVGSV